MECLLRKNTWHIGCTYTTEHTSHFQGKSSGNMHNISTSSLSLKLCSLTTITPPTDCMISRNGKKGVNDSLAQMMHKQSQTPWCCLTAGIHSVFLFTKAVTYCVLYTMTVTYFRGVHSKEPCLLAMSTLPYIFQSYHSTQSLNPVHVNIPWHSRMWCWKN